MNSEHTPEVPRSHWRDAACYIVGPLCGFIGAIEESGGIVGFCLGLMTAFVFVMWMLS